jgi:hypothetical protein
MNEEMKHLLKVRHRQIGFLKTISHLMFDFHRFPSDAETPMRIIGTPF